MIDERGRETWLRFTGSIFACLLTAIFLAGSPAFAQTIVDEWATVKAPPPPELR